MKIRQVLLLAFGCLVALPAYTQIRNVPPTSMNPQFVLPAIDTVPPAVQNAKDNRAYTDAKIDNQAKIDSANAYAIPAERKFELWEILDSGNPSYPDSFKVKRLVTNVRIIDHDGQVTKMDTQTDTATLYISGYSNKVFVATMTWHTNAVYDTTWTEVARVEDAASNPGAWAVLTNIAKAPNSGKPGISSKSFTYVSVASSPSVLEFKPVLCDRLEFFGERFNGHGNVKIFVDGPDGAWMQVATLFQGANPWITDLDRMQPSFGYTFPKKSWNSPPTMHKIKFETDGGNQYMQDFIRVMKYTLTPRGGLTQTTKSNYSNPKKQGNATKKAKTN